MIDQTTALALTLAVELSVVVAWSRRARVAAGARRGAEAAWSRIIAAGLLPSLLTHPFAWRAAAALPVAGYARGVLVIELVVVLVETVLLRLLLRCHWREAFLLALLANAASVAVGALLAQAGEGRESGHA
ncbi:MAG: hypothetical protein ACKO7G_09315 [Gammaproteobacteria bacterium]